jgi:RNA polymerase sigma-70 factor (ECF subfamily)
MGGEDIFTALVDEHYQALYRFGLSLTRSEPDASDLTQQTFLIWANKGYQLRDPAKARFWLFRTLHRCFLQDRRHSGRFVHHELESVADELPTLEPETVDEIDGPTVLAALAKVGAPYRAAVALFYLDQLSYSQIAEALDVSLGTVKSRISRGLAQIRLAQLCGTSLFGD